MHEQRAPDVFRQRIEHIRERKSLAVKVGMVLGLPDPYSALAGSSRAYGRRSQNHSNGH
jgi:hypothetical protein